MIRVFCAFGKTYFNKISDLILFDRFMDAFKAEEVTCPSCGARHSCTNFDFYPRNMISYEQGAVVCNIISVLRVDCNSCNTTHAILPDILIPHSSYSLSFILKVLTSVPISRFQYPHCMPGFIYSRNRKVCGLVSSRMLRCHLMVF